VPDTLSGEFTAKITYAPTAFEVRSPEVRFTITK
jgi:hypothetical protein